MTRTASLVVLLAMACAGMTGCGGSGSVTERPTQPAGSLTVSSCTIAEGASSCAATVTWTTAGATSVAVLVGGATVASAPSGTTTVAVGAASQTVTLLGGTAQLDQKPVAGSCVVASAWDGGQCRAFAIRLSERAPTPFVENGRAVTLEVVIYRPLGSGPFPAVLFNHGSTGNGDDPSQFTVTYTNEAVARFFAERGWLVAFPQRRGRGSSDGLYDEGFTPDRSRYSCLQAPALAGFERALLDVDAAADYLVTRSDVDSTRMLSAGTSRGGILATVHAAKHPDLFDGAINFVGGWLGEACQDALAVNRTTFVRGATFNGPTLWLYGDNDPFYSLTHSRGNFDAFVAAGGRGSFGIFTRAPTLNGHFLVNDAALWGESMDGFLRQLAR